MGESPYAEGEKEKEGRSHIGGAKDKRVAFYESGECLQLQCDGRRSSLMVDTDGTLLGQAGTAGNSQ